MNGSNHNDIQTYMEQLFAPEVTTIAVEEAPNQQVNNDYKEVLVSKFQEKMRQLRLERSRPAPRPNPSLLPPFQFHVHVEYPPQQALPPMAVPSVITAPAPAPPMAISNLVSPNHVSPAQVNAPVTTIKPEREEEEIMPTPTSAPVVQDASVAGVVARALNIPGWEGSIRTMNNLFSLVDVIGVVTKKDANQSAEVFRRMSKNRAFKAKCFVCQFPGERQRPTPVGDFDTVLAVVALCPGKAGTQFLLTGMKVIRQFLAGDVENLSNQMRALNNVQDNAILNAARQRNAEEQVLSSDQLFFLNRLHPLNKKTHAEYIDSYRIMMKTIAEFKEKSSDLWFGMNPYKYANGLETFAITGRKAWEIRKTTKVPTGRFNYNQRHVRDSTNFQEEVADKLDDKIAQGKCSCEDFREVVGEVFKRYDEIRKTLHPKRQKLLENSAHKTNSFVRR
jgi:hypothetical protein